MGFAWRIQDQKVIKLTWNKGVENTSCKADDITDDKTNDVETVYFSVGCNLGCCGILIKKLTIQYQMRYKPANQWDCRGRD